MQTTGFLNERWGIQNINNLPNHEKHPVQDIDLQQPKHMRFQIPYHINQSSQPSS